MGENVQLIPFFQDAIPRPRVTALVQEAAQSPLLTVVAGPGYGKTRAVSSYLAGVEARVVWLRMTKLDNLPQRFWESFTSAVEDVDEALAASMREIGFPDTLRRFDAFIHIFARNVYAAERMFIVLDEFEHITDNAIIRFIEEAIKFNIENLCMVLISRTYVGLNMLDLRDNHLLSQLTADDLRFTGEEIEDLFRERNVAPNLDRETFEHMEGWPLAVDMLASYCCENPEDTMLAGFDLLQVTRHFEREYYAPYPPQVQKLLLKVSLLHYFHAEIIAVLSGDVEQMLDVLQQSPFANFNPLNGVITFQNMYRDFLARRAAALSQEDQCDVYSTAGDWFMQKGDVYSAIIYYEKCRRYDDMYQAILSIPRNRMERKLADFILEYLGRLPEEYVQTHPMVQCSMAAMLLNNFEIEKAHDIWMGLRHSYEKKEPTPEHLAFLGEIYIMLADVSLIRNTEEFAWYYKRAAECLPNGSTMRDNKLMLAENNSLFFLPGNGPGELERLTGIIKESMPVAAKVMNGCGYGMEDILLSEAAYYVNDMTKARELAYKAIYKGREMQQHDVICNGHQMLMGVALLKGDYVEAQKQLKEIEEYASEHSAGFLPTLRDCAQAWFYNTLGDPDKIPHWILEEDAGAAKQSPIGIGRSQLIRTTCLIYYKGSVYEALAQLEQLEGFYKKRGLWTSLLYLYIERAICRMMTDDKELAMRALHHAYEMTYHNGIITPFAEMSNPMRSLMDLAKNSTEYAFDPEWVETVRQKASTHAKRAAAMRVEYKKSKGVAAAPAVQLTRREKEVLQCLAQGLKRDEIGGALNISVNTVKSIIKSIYSKLDAANRAEAVHIANVVGLLG